MMRGAGLLLALGCTSCVAKPSAASVCEKLTAAGVAENCHTEAPGGIGASATEKFAFDIPKSSGKTGQVLKFDGEAAYAATVKTFDGMAGLVGPHRYGSEKALIFVQLNNETPAELGANARTVVAGL